MNANFNFYPTKEKKKKNVGKKTIVRIFKKNCVLRDFNYFMNYIWRISSFYDVNCYK